MNLEPLPAPSPDRKDCFLSEEDLDLANLSDEDLQEWWNLWLNAAQSTNDDDQFEYSHGVFRREPFSKS